MEARKHGEKINHRRAHMNTYIFKSFVLRRKDAKKEKSEKLKILNRDCRDYIRIFRMNGTRMHEDSADFHGY